MSLLRLADHAAFNPADDIGIILDSRAGVYLSLNEIATLMLRTALSSTTRQEFVDYLPERVEATPPSSSLGW